MRRSRTCKEPGDKAERAGGCVAVFPTFRSMSNGATSGKGDTAGSRKPSRMDRNGLWPHVGQAAQDAMHAVLRVKDHCVQKTDRLNTQLSMRFSCSMGVGRVAALHAQYQYRRVPVQVLCLFTGIVGRDVHRY